MRERISIPFAFVTAVWVSGSLLVAAPVRPETPARFIGALDGSPTTIESSADGTAWSAWAWRTGGEFDIALSHRDADGVWSRPVFVSRNDGADQIEPALARDTSGHLYLVFAEQPSFRIYLSVLPAGATAWSAPIPVTPEGVRARTPALEVVGGHLVLAYRTDRGVSIQVLGTVGPAVRDPLGIQDGPDPVGPSGATPGGGKGDGGSGSPVEPTPLGGS